MRLQLQTYLLVAVGCFFSFSGQAQAQCASCEQAAAAVAPHAGHAYSQAAEPTGTGCGCKTGGCRVSGCKSGRCQSGGCKPTGPTVQGELPVLPIRTACDSPWGRDNIPSLFTPPRSYTPPVGKAVGRPLLGPWNGF